MIGARLERFDELVNSIGPMGNDRQRLAAASGMMGNDRSDGE
jgi:hypothetical protein